MDDEQNILPQKKKKMTAGNRLERSNTGEENWDPLEQGRDSWSQGIITVLKTSEKCHGKDDEV